MTQRRVFWIGSAAVLALLALLQALRDREEGAAYFVGSFLGALIAPVAIAFVLFWIVSKLSKQVAAWSPWVLVSAAALSAIVLAGEVGRDVSDRAEFDAAAERCVHPRDPFGRPPRGVSYEPPEPAVERALAEAAAGGDIDPDTYEIRLVVQDRQPVARLLAARGLDDEEARRDFVNGALESLREQVTDEPVVEEIEQGQLVTWSEGAAVIAPKGCKMVAIYAVDEESARYLAEAVFGS